MLASHAVVLRGDPPKSLLIAIESVRLGREGNDKHFHEQ